MLKYLKIDFNFILESKIKIIKELSKYKQKIKEKDEDTQKKREKQKKKILKGLIEEMNYIEKNKIST